MALLIAKLDNGQMFTSPLRLSELIPYWREVGLVEHPNRPKFPPTLWMVDLSLFKLKEKFPSTKPIRITIDQNRGLFNDTECTVPEGNTGS